MLWLVAVVVCGTYSLPLAAAFLCLRMYDVYLNAAAASHKTQQQFKLHKTQQQSIFHSPNSHIYLRPKFPYIFAGCARTLRTRGGGGHTENEMLPERSMSMAANSCGGAGVRAAGKEDD